MAPGIGGAQVLNPLRAGANNDITDVEGILVGHFTNLTAPARTGTTVLVLPEQAIAGVDVRGGGPGTVETDVLDARRPVNKLDAVFLSGGSAYGLAAREGVVRCVDEAGRGFRLAGRPGRSLPMVAGAIIFDLARGGDFSARPTADYGYQACKAAAKGPVAQGTVGAGTGAESGGVKGGFGTASVDLGNGVIVGAVAVVNSVGATFRSDRCNELYTAYLELSNEFGDYKPARCPSGSSSSTQASTESSEPSAEGAPDDGLPDLEPLNTTLGVVAVNVTLDKAQINKMATASHDGMARSIRPSHTLLDGDTLFSLSTARLDLECVSREAGADPDLILSDIYSAAADTFSRAANHAILRATTVGDSTSYCDQFEGVCSSFPGQSNQASSTSCARGTGSLAATGGPSVMALAGAALFLLSIQMIRRTRSSSGMTQ